MSERLTDRNLNGTTKHNAHKRMAKAYGKSNFHDGIDSQVLAQEPQAIL
jgi:hypothetical protein